MKHNMKRLLALIMVLSLCFSLLSNNILAAEASADETAILSSESVDEQEAETEEKEKEPEKKKEKEKESDPEPEPEKEKEKEKEEEPDPEPEPEKEKEVEEESDPEPEPEKEKEANEPSESGQPGETSGDQTKDTSETEPEPSEDQSSNQSGDQSEDTSETEPEQSEDQSEDQSDQAEDEDVPQTPAFESSVTVDGVTVTVNAPEGVFPDGATLSVEKAEVTDRKAVGKAVDKVREENTNVTFSYTFDIKVLDADGTEVQPANGERVQVRFATSDVANVNLDTRVYHVSENQSGHLSAEELEVTQEVTKSTGEESTAAVETDGFSFYTVEFTYDLKQYVLPGGSSAALSEVLEAVGLSGEVTEISVSNEDLFSVSKETGEWVITAKQAFSTEEWLKVTLDGVEFEIVVTDSGTVDSASYLDAAWDAATGKVNFTAKTAESCTAVTSDDTAWTDGWYVVNGNVTIASRISVTGSVHLILADGAKLTASKGITVKSDNTLEIYGQSGGTGTLNATSSGSSAIGVGDGWGSPAVGDIVINGGNVTATGNTGIGYSTTRVNPLKGTLTVYGGTVAASTNADGAGIGGAWNDGGLKTVTIYGGVVTANGGVRAAAIGGGCQNRDNPSSGKGGDVYIYGGTVTAKVKEGTTYGGEGKTPVAIGRGDGGSDDGSITLGRYMVLYGGTSESNLVTIASPYTARYKYMKAVYVPPVASVTDGGTTTEYGVFSDAVSAWNSASNGATLTLLADVTTTSTISVSGTKTLDLNGYGIKFTGNFANSNSVIFIRGNGNELTLKDSRPNETTHYFTAPASGAGLATDISDTNSGSQQSFHGGYLTGGNCFSGGGIRVDGGGKLFMQGGTIIGNQGKYGGGMDVERSGSAGGSAVITGGVIMYNYGSEWTGGIHTNHANSLSISNCTITNNAAKNGIGGINWEAENDSATMSCSGNTVIENNMAGGTESNVCLASGKYISVSGTLSGGASIGVTMASPGVFTTGETDNNDETKFTSDSAAYEVRKNADGQLELYAPPAASVTDGGTTTEYAVFSDAVSAWNSAESGATLTLLDDVTTGSTIQVSNTRTLDLNGYGITKTGGDNVIWITGGNLTVNDSNTTTTHYYNVNNGIAVNVNAASGEKSFHGGYITGGTGHSYDGLFGGDGGGVYLDGGSFTLNGGTILGNSTGSAPNFNDNGGGVEIYSGTMTMNGGTICYNSSGIGLRAGSSANNRGGGATTATFLMNDGVIANNKKRGIIHDWWCYGDDYATFNGGSVINNGEWGISAKYLTIAGSVTVSGNANGVTFASTTAAISGSPVISGNTGANLKVNNGKSVNVSGSLSGANIGITMQTPGVFTTGDTTYNDASKFTSDNSSYIVGKNADGQLYLGTPVAVTYKVVNGTWSDGSTEDKTENVASGSQGASAPTGMKPNDDYMGGAWNTDPTAANITEATTFTYTFELKTPAVVTAAPEAQDLTYTGSAQALVSTGTAEGGTMQYALGADASTEPDASAYSASISTGTDAGTYYVWYRAEGDENHLNSDAACVTAEIKKADITPTVSIDDWVYGESASAPSVSGNSGNGGVTYTYAKKGTTDFTASVPSGAGEYTVKAVIAETANYKSGTATSDFKIKKADPDVTSPTANTLTYNGSEQELVTAGSSSNGEMQYSLSETGSYSTSIPIEMDANTYTVWYKVIGDDNHSDTDPESVSVTIAQREVELKWTNTNLIYNGQEQKPTAAVTNLVAADEGKVSVTVTGGQTDASDTAYTATASALTGDRSSNYKLPAANTTSFTIGQKEVGLSWSDTSFTYDGESHKPSATATGLADGDTCTVTVTGAQTDAGDYTATASALSNSNYKLPSAKTTSFSIGQKEVGLTWSDTSFTYDGESHKPAAAATGLIDGDTCTVTVTGEQTDAGDYTATASALSNSNYKLPDENTTDFTIDPKEVSLTWSNTSFTYDGGSHKPAAAATGLIDGDTCTVTVTGEQTDVGDYTATASALSNSNYKLPDENTTDFTIGQKEVGLIWTNTRLTYNGQEQKPTAAATNLVDEDKGKVFVTVTGAQTDASDTAYTAEASGLTGDRADNYTLPENCTSTFTIAKASLGTPHVSMQNYTYGRSLSTPGISEYVGGGAVTYYYSASNRHSGGTKWTDSMTATSLDIGTWYVYAVIAPTKNYLGYTTRATRFEVTQGFSTVSGSSSFGEFSGEVTLTLRSCDSGELVASDRVRLNGGAGGYHFAHIPQGRYILTASWTEAEKKNVMKQEVEIQ